MIPLLRASHLQPTLAVTALTTALAVAAGRGAGSVWVALALLSGQLFVGWSNDWLDRERDRRARRDDKPIAAGEVPAGVVGSAAVVALVLCVPLSLANGWRAGLVHLGAVASGGAYNVALKRTVLSPVPYALSFGALPYVVTLGLPGHPAPAWWAPVAAALLGVGAHFVNTLHDQDDDRRLGVDGLPQRCGRSWSLAAGTTLLAAAGLLLALAPPGPPSGFAPLLLGGQVVAVGAVAVVATSGHARGAWSLVLAAAALAVALLVTQSSAIT